MRREVGEIEKKGIALMPINEGQRRIRLPDTAETFVGELLRSIGKLLALQIMRGCEGVH